MPSEATLQLVQEAKLSQTTGSLRAYHTERVRHVMLETRQLHAELAPMAEVVARTLLARAGVIAPVAQRPPLKGKV